LDVFSFAATVIAEEGVKTQPQFAEDKGGWVGEKNLELEWSNGGGGRVRMMQRKGFPTRSGYRCPEIRRFQNKDASPTIQTKEIVIGDFCLIIDNRRNSAIARGRIPVTITSRSSEFGRRR
ncbi:hypothetical protein Taro_010719, partial [Colocasia esculenta]|nr:hypothetical protein [Colocasia esculenta]